MADIEPDIDEIYLGSGQTCKLWDISRVTLGTWVTEGFPQLKRGKYPLFAGAEWVRKFKTETDASMAEAKKREMTARASLRELELLVKEGKLIARDEVLQAFVERIHATKTGLTAFSRKLAPLVANKPERECMEIMNREIDELLQRFSRKGGVLK